MKAWILKYPPKFDCKRKYPKGKIGSKIKSCTRMRIDITLSLQITRKVYCYLLKYLKATSSRRHSYKQCSKARYRGVIPNSVTLQNPFWRTRAQRCLCAVTRAIKICYCLTILVCQKWKIMGKCQVWCHTNIYEIVFTLIQQFK